MNSAVEFFRETERGSPVLLREFKLRILVELVMQSSIFFFPVYRVMIKKSSTSLRDRC